MNNIVSSEKLEWAKKLFSHLTSEIRFIKQLQWRITYYSVAIMAGIYYSIREKKLSCDIVWLLIIVIIIIIISSILFILKVNQSIIINRKYLNNIKKQFPIISNLILETFEDRQKDLSKYKDILYILIITISIIITGIYICILIWSMKNSAVGSAHDILFALADS